MPVTSRSTKRPWRGIPHLGMSEGSREWWFRVFFLVFVTDTVVNINLKSKLSTTDFLAPLVFVGIKALLLAVAAWGMASVLDAEKIQIRFAQNLVWLFSSVVWAVAVFWSPSGIDIFTWLLKPDKIQAKFVCNFWTGNYDTDVSQCVAGLGWGAFLLSLVVAAALGLAICIFFEWLHQNKNGTSVKKVWRIWLLSGISYAFVNAAHAWIIRL